MPERVATTDPEGVDYGWVVQVTFVLAIAIGSPVVAVLGLGADLPTWSARLSFAIRVGALVWLLVGVAVLTYAKFVRTD
ncbi:MAG: DUF5822 domain-containing protein [Halanaeroarchaeum sp.]